MSEINTTSNGHPKGSETGFLTLIIVTAIVILTIFSSFGGCGKAVEKTNEGSPVEHVHEH